MNGNISLLENERRIQVSQVYPPLLHELQAHLTCSLCEGVVFSPVECSQCRKIYCSTHKSKMGGCMKCGCQSFKDTVNISREYVVRLLNLKIMCCCTSELFRYTQYILHHKQCQENLISNNHNFKIFSAINSSTGKKQPLLPKQNTMINLNLKHKQQGFFDENDIYYDLKQMNRSYYVLKDNKHIKEKLEFELAKEHNRCPYWTVDLERNHYSLYDPDNQLRIEKAYQSKRATLELEIGKDRYTINLAPEKCTQVNNRNGYERVVNRTEL